MEPFAASNENRSHFSSVIAGILIGANVTGVMLSYALTLFLARTLDSNQFDSFVGAIAVLTMLGAVSEAGVGKYGYKRLPLADRASDTSERNAYLRFAKRTVFLCSAIFVACGIFLESALPNEAVEFTSITSVLFIPAVAGCGVAVDLLIASQSPITGTLIARALVPTITLSLIVVGSQTIRGFDATMAVICFGIGSTLGLLLCAALLQRFRWMGKTNVGEIQWQHWISRSLSYFAVTCAITWLFKAPLVMLHHLPHSAAELGLLAPAFETGCLVLLLSKSADKYYLPMLAVAIDQGDIETDERLRRRRQSLIGGAACIFWLAIVLIGKQILSLFGPQFVVSYPALLWVTTGACIWTLFSLSPSALLFMRRSKQLALNLIFHSLALMVLIPIAFYQHGNTGVAFVFAVCLASTAAIARIQESIAWKSESETMAT
ncbi:lipopolysaccharide biosynthesis protein [Roseiconus lacunae]|uniref:lipopolysaccharide biosynthesis protein n=1 Tax=Roseiconus lacunae TaxID=2605694 RepID=UPI001E53F6F2|nr:hypothetical protein [Roseiconus lacunae]MCD0458852.1 hypothetical protein [Roseiconus lacunae]